MSRSSIAIQRVVPLTFPDVPVILADDEDDDSIREIPKSATTGAPFAEIKMFS